MPASTTGKQIAKKTVICTHCAQPTEVGRKAMSVFCPHCKKRLILENFKIKSYYAVRDFATCGDIIVEKGGHVVAPIKVGNLTVKGKVQGTVTARGEVRIQKTGSVKGDIKAPALHIEQGAVLEGFLRIGLTDDKVP